MTNTEAESIVEKPGWPDAPIGIAVIEDIAKEWPHWRAIRHTTDSGRRVMMIEFAEPDRENEFGYGLENDFVEMVAEFDRGDDDAE